MRYLLILITLFSTTLLITTRIVIAETSEHSIKIGHITDQVGIGAFFGVASVKGIQLGLDELKSAGFKVELITEETGGKNSGAALAAQKLIQKDHVDGIICDLTGPCSIISEITAKAKIPLIYHSPSREVSSKNPYAFRNFIDYEDSCRKLAEQLGPISDKMVGSLNGNLEFGELCLSGINSVFPNHASYRNDPYDDLRSIATALFSRKIQYLFMTGYEQDLLQLIKLLNEHDSAAQLLFIEVLITKESYKLIKQLKTGPSIAGFPNPSEVFLSKIRAKFSSNYDFVPGLSAVSYNSLIAMSEALNTCSPKDLQCIEKKFSIPSKLSEMHFEGLSKGKPSYPTTIKSIKEFSFLE